MSITCPSCSHTSPENKSFCVRCGFKIPSGTAVPPQPIGGGGGGGKKTQILKPNFGNSPAMGSAPQPSPSFNNSPNFGSSPQPQSKPKKTMVFNHNSNPLSGGRTVVGKPDFAQTRTPGNATVVSGSEQTSNVADMVNRFGDSRLVGFLVARDFLGNQNGTFWPLRVGRITIGRSQSEADVLMPFDNVSSSHSIIIFRQNGRCWISDNNSVNGTFINGTDIGPDRVDLKHGDTITIGGHSLTIVLLPDEL